MNLENINVSALQLLIVVHDSIITYFECYDEGIYYVPEA